MLVAPRRRTRGFARVGLTLTLAALYYLSAQLGLSLGVAEQVTAVWPPSGIALAALLILGAGSWPGIWLGALLANAGANEPLGTALGIATGNTLEALAGLWMLRQVAFAPALTRLRDVLALVLVALLSTALAATIGVASLCLGAVQPWDEFAHLWWVWWLGDAIGILLVAPALLAWYARPRNLASWRRRAEFLALVAGLIWATQFVFRASYDRAIDSATFAYAVFPFVIWMALRFGQHGTTIAVLVTSCLGTWATARGLGPFGSPAFGQRWLYLQGFIAVVALTGLSLGAAIGERDRIGRHRAAEHAVTSLLAGGTTVAEALPRILRAICEHLDFDVGAFWRADPRAGVLRCAEFWQAPSITVPEFASVTRERAFPPGVGLPGRVWSSGTAAWIEDVVEDPNFPRAPVAAREHLHGAFAFPIVLEHEVLGVLEFFSRESRRADEHLLRLLESIGSHVGQFIERKSAEEEVHASEARKAAVLASVLDGIVTIDGEGKLLEFNRGAELIFGFRATEVLGREMALLIVPERFRGAHRQGLVRMAEGRPGTMLDRRMEMPALRADGSEFTIELTITRVPGSERAQFTGFMRDITQRRRAEEEKEALLAREQDARCRAEELAENLRKEQSAKDRFLAMLGHELRNPLAPIANALQLIRLRSAGFDRTTLDLHGIMERQMRHMVRLVDDLLDVSRIANGAIGVRRERVDLLEIVRRVVETQRAALEERRHRLVLAFPGDLPDGEVPLDGDATRLEQVVSNLLNNAARYTPPGGTITVALETSAAEAVLRVRDSGIGIRSEDLTRIFDVFVQADRIPGSANEGLGVGLALVKQITLLHGGSIHAASEGPGRGSEFVVRLPLAVESREQEPAPAGGATGAHSLPAPRRTRVLVVDDNRDSADTLAMILRGSGHEATVAYDGASALARFVEATPEIVFMDIELPGGMNGYEVARRMRQQAGDRRIEFVALTGYGLTHDQHKSREAGFRLHLVKPVDPRALGELAGSLAAAEIPAGVRDAADAKST